MPIPKVTQQTQFTASDVVELYTTCGAMGIQLWIDGGWGVDALLGKQTLPHADLDIAIQKIHAPMLRELLEDRGYQDVIRDDTSAWNYVLGDAEGRLVDFHVIIFDKAGNGVLGPVENGNFYPAESLTGHGKILDTEVYCISPEWMVKFHTGYPLRESDFHDVNALCTKFDIPLPDEYQP